MSQQSYLAAVSRALDRALCIQAFPSPVAERQSPPQVEVCDSPELLLEPVTIRRTSKDKERECVLIEPSINSVRVSIRFHAGDALETELLAMQMRFLMQRADQLQCLRKVPSQGYHLTLLITDALLVSMGKRVIARFIVQLIQQSESEISALKLAVNARGRAVATQLLRSLAF